MCVVTGHLPLPAPPATQRPRGSAAPTSAQPRAPPPFQLLQHVMFSVWDGSVPALQGQHLHQQLAALPSLTTLTCWEGRGLAAELHSTRVTRLCFEGDESAPTVVPRLRAQFPNLVELDASWCWAVRDGVLEALLGVRSLRRVRVRELELQRSHARRPCAWEELSLTVFSVDQVVLLPLEGIQRLRAHGEDFLPSRDAQAVARVAAAAKRGGGLGAVRFNGEDPAALLTTLRPLLEATGAEEAVVRALYTTKRRVFKRLGQQLPPAVRTLSLERCCLPRKAWAAVLPRLPATVTCLKLSAMPAEENVLALCAGAVRPITVYGWYMGADKQQRILSQLARQGNTVTMLRFLFVQSSAADLPWRFVCEIAAFGTRCVGGLATH